MQEALKQMQGSTSDQNEKAHTLARMGFLSLEQGLHEQALTFYEDALGLAYPQANQQLIDSILPAIAVVYFSLGDAATARYFLTQIKHQPDLAKCLPQCTQLQTLLSLETDSSQETMGVSLVTNTTNTSIGTSKLSIQGFGEPVVIIDGQPIKHWRTARAMELFFYLLNTGQPVSKERIIHALWTHTSKQTNQAFYTAVHHLRKALGAQALVFQSGHYYLDLAARYGEQIWYDVKAFQTYDTQARLALARGDDGSAKLALAQMLVLYHGDYGRPFYNNWCSIQRDKLRTIYQEALRQLAWIAWRESAVAECAEHWRHLLLIDNCLEEAHLGLMQCYAHQGKRNLALRQYQACYATLQQELGVEPETSIQLFYQSLISTHTPAPKR